jgi:hypothetical protein
VCVEFSRSGASRSATDRRQERNRNDQTLSTFSCPRSFRDPVCSSGLRWRQQQEGGTAASPRRNVDCIRRCQRPNARRKARPRHEHGRPDRHARCFGR